MTHQVLLLEPLRCPLHPEGILSLWQIALRSRSHAAGLAALKADPLPQALRCPAAQTACWHGAEMAPARGGPSPALQVPETHLAPLET